MKRVLITGASSAIGLEVCKIYLHRGWSIFAQYRKTSAALVQLAEQFPNQLQLRQIDFDDFCNLSVNLELIDLESHSFDAFVSCAAMLDPQAYGEITQDSLLQHFNVNVVPNILITQKLMPHMIRKEWGRIVYLSSVGVKFGGGPNSFSYSLTKHALEFFPNVAKSWALKNVLINTVRVGVTDTTIHQRDPSKDVQARTRLIPMQRMAQAKEIAEFACHFASELNTYVTLQVLPITGGE